MAKMLPTPKVARRRRSSVGLSSAPRRRRRRQPGRGTSHACRSPCRLHPHGRVDRVQVSLHRGQGPFVHLPNTRSCHQTARGLCGPPRPRRCHCRPRVRQDALPFCGGPQTVPGHSRRLLCAHHQHAHHGRQAHHDPPTPDFCLRRTQGVRAVPVLPHCSARHQPFGGQLRSRRR